MLHLLLLYFQGLVEACEFQRAGGMARHPEILWAQRSDKVYLTVELLDAKSPDVKLLPEGRFTFSATVGANNQKFETDLELYAAIDVEKSVVNKGQRHTTVVLEKTTSEWWPRLVKATGKAPQFVKVDWNKWVDEDEEDEAPAMDMGGMGGMGGGMGGMPDFSAMGGMGGMGGGMPDFSGMGGMGGDDDDDIEDDDDMPELSKVEDESATESAPTTAAAEVKPEDGAQESKKPEAAKI